MPAEPSVPRYRVTGVDYSQEFYLDKRTRWALHLGTKPALHEIYDSAAQRFLCELDAWLKLPNRRSLLLLRHEFRLIQVEQPCRFVVVCGDK